MTKANDLASLLDANGDVVSSALDNVPAAPTPSLTSLGIPNHDDITVDGSGNVGISEVSPTSKLTIGGNANTATNPTVQITDTTNGGSITLRGQSPKLFFDVTAGGVGKILMDSAGFEFKDGTLDAEGNVALKIDSSGNLQLGKTASGIGTNGITLYGDGAIGAADFTRDGDRTLALNRKTSDGDIMEFRKDGSTVGSIGTNENTDLYIAGGDTGLLFNDNVDFICPATATGSGRDNAVDLGYSTVRFKNLYLSGGVYLGGTGSANYLDDYEEGTWTPSIAFGGGSTGMTFVQRSGSYTKIGRLVYINGIIVFSNKGTSTGNVTFSNLPFTVADILPSTGNGGALNIHYFSDSTASHLYSFFAEGQNYGTGLYPQVDHGNELNQTDFNNNTSLRLNGVYQTT